MTTTAPPPTTAPDQFWTALEQEHARTVSPPRRARQAELLRLRDVLNDYRFRYFPELPLVTVTAGECMQTGVLALASPIGSWGQGVAITVKASLLVPIAPGIENTDRRSVIWGQPLRLDAAGEQLRQLEVDLVLLHELVHAEHRWRGDRGDDVGCDSEWRSYDGHGVWFLSRCNQIWRVEAERRGLPFAPVRHSRVARERAQQFITEDDARLQSLTHLRSSCAQWPFDAIAAPWSGRAPSDPTDAEQQALDLLPDLLEAHYRQALIGTNAAEALAEPPRAPAITPAEPSPEPVPVVVEPEPPATTFPCPFDAAGAHAALQQQLSARNLAAYIELARLLALDLRELDQPEVTEQPRQRKRRDAGSPRARTEAHVEDLAAQAEQRLAEAIARRPALGVVIDALRRWGASPPADVRRALMAELGLKTAGLAHLIYRGRDLLASVGTPPRRFEVGTRVALRDQPAVHGTIAAITGKRAQLQIDGSQNWLEAPLDQLEFLAAATPESRRPKPGPAAQAAIERRRARRAAATTTTTA